MLFTDTPFHNLNYYYSVYKMGFPRQTRQSLGPPYFIQDWQLKQLQLQRKLLLLLAIQLLLSTLWVLFPITFSTNPLLSLLTTAPHSRPLSLTSLLIDLFKVSFCVIDVLYCFSGVKHRKKVRYQYLVAFIDYVMFSLSTLPIIAKTVFFLFYSPHRKYPIMFAITYVVCVVGVKLLGDCGWAQGMGLLVVQTLASMYILLKLQYALRILIKRPLSVKVCRIKYLKDAEKSTHYSG